MKSLFSAYWAFTKSLEKGMKDYGLNYGNPKVILYIMRNEGCRQIDIAKDCYIESATLSTLLFYLCLYIQDLVGVGKMAHSHVAYCHLV